MIAQLVLPLAVVLANIDLALEDFVISSVDLGVAFKVGLTTTEGLIAFYAHWTRRNWRSNVEGDESTGECGEGEGALCYALSIGIDTGSSEKSVGVNGCSVGSKWLLDVGRRVCIRPMSSVDILIPEISNRWAHQVDWTPAEVVRSGGEEEALNNVRGVRPTNEASMCLFARSATGCSCARVLDFVEGA